MTRFHVLLDGGFNGDEHFEAEDMDEAVEIAKAWAAEGTWPRPATVDITVINTVTREAEVVQFEVGQEAGS